MDAVELSQNATHIAFVDETNHNIGRYRGVGVITLSIAHLERINAVIRKLLNEATIREFKWHRLQSARERFAALKMVDYVTCEAREQRLQVGVLSWDTTDSRHRVPGRGDIRKAINFWWYEPQSAADKAPS